jgi:hypothetical protein
VFTFLVILIVVGVVVVLALRASAVGRSRRSPAEQPTVVRPDPHAAGADRPATRPGSDEPIPGSAEDRHRHGKP